MKQLVQPNLNTVGTLGYCLVYVRDVFSAPWAGTDAWTSWNSYTKLKHTDALPSGVYVPIWFDGYWNGQRLGHTAVYKDGKVWSSPYKANQSYAVLNSIAEVERIYGMKYVGWSEDIGGKQVVTQGDDMSTVGEVEFNNLWLSMFGPMERNAPTAGDRKRWIGAETNTVIREMYADARYLAYQQYIKDLERAASGSQPSKYKPYNGKQLFEEV